MNDLYLFLLNVVASNTGGVVCRRVEKGGRYSYDMLVRLKRRIIQEHDKRWRTTLPS